MIMEIFFYLKIDKFALIYPISSLLCVLFHIYGG